MLPLGSVTVLELPTHSAVAGCDCDATGQDETSLLNDSAANEREGAIDEGRGGGTMVLVCIDVDAGESAQFW